MDLFFKVGIFIGVALVLNYVVNLVYKYVLKKTKAIHLRFSKSVVNVMIDVVVIYSLAQQFDITKDISKVLLQSGSLIIAIATFAAQQALGNVISGISISASKPYNEDEKIRVVQGGTVIAEGIVKDVTLRHTVIYQFNGESCIVPNSVMDADVEKAIQIMKKVCAEHTLTLNTEANAVTASGYTQNGIVLKTTIWTENLNDSFQACSDIRIALVAEFRKNGIEIPYQTVTVNAPFHT